MAGEESNPDSWELAQIGDIADLLRGVSYKKTDASNQPEENKVPILRGNNIQAGKMIADDLVYVPKERVSSDQMLSTRDVVLTMSSGSADLVGKAALNSDGFYGSFGAFCGVLRAYRTVSEKYLYYFLSSQAFKRQVLPSSKGTNINNLKREYILCAAMPLAPREEQSRIVGKIEELFSELDKGVESLKAARARLKTYRQSLLKAAFEGRLTEQWRLDNADKLESADQLLQRIREEREVRYQQQLEEWNVAVAEWEADGKSGKKPRKPVKPKWFGDVDEEELDRLGQLPKGWTWVRYGNICQEIRNGVSKAPSGERGDKIFRISAVRPMAFDMSDYRFLDNSSGEFDEYFLFNGDIVFTRYNGSRGYVGVSAVFRSNEKFLYPDKLIRTRLASSQVSPYFIEAASNSGSSRKFIENRIRTTAGQSGISGTDIKMMPVPLCSLEEQNRIVDYLEQAWSRILEIENAIEVALCRADMLRQSILKRAFQGKLVPQKPDDEPASVLLERIRREQTDAPKPNRRKRKTGVAA